MIDEEDKLTRKEVEMMADLIGRFATSKQQDLDEFTAIASNPEDDHNFDPEKMSILRLMKQTMPHHYESAVESWKSNESKKQLAEIKMLITLSNKLHILKSTL